MRTHKSPNQRLTKYFEENILPEIPSALGIFDERLDAKGLPPRKYYLFGSFAEGNLSSRSDVDIAMVFDSQEKVSNKAFTDLLGERGTLTRIKGARIEVTMFDQETMEMMRQENPKIREIWIERPPTNPERLR